MIRAVFRSVLVVNRGSLLGAFGVAALATALLTATGTWLQAGWSASGPELGMLSVLASSFAGTTTIIAVFVVASTFSSALRRRRTEFALLRSIGATAAQVRGQVTAEVLVVVLCAALPGALAGVLIAPSVTGLLVSSGIVPSGFALPFSVLSVAATLAVLLPTALVAGRLAARESVRLSPIESLRESSFEAVRVSRGRALTAAVTAVAGLLAAAAPMILPGIIGTAAGTTSALLLIVAGALAGPALIGRLATRGAQAMAPRLQNVTVLAAVNARGFSRRSTAVILPLALLLCLGVVQSGAGAGAAKAAGIQTERALASVDLVVSAPQPGGPLDAGAVEAVPGVIAAASTAVVRGSARVGEPDADLPFLDTSSRDQVAVRILGPVSAPLLDPDVTAGSLADLDGDRTVAVSADALAFTGKGIGDSIDVRLDGMVDLTARIVAVYDNGMGVGDYLLSEDAVPPAALTAVAVSTTVLVRTDPGAEAAVQTALESRGYAVTEPHGQAQAAQRADGAEQSLSNVLLLALLAFIAVAALQTLAGLTSGRRAEFALLRRIGMTRTQIAGMLAAESAFVAGASLVLGLAAALPALVGIGVGLTGAPFAALDPAVLFPLAGVVVALPFGTMVGVGWHTVTSVSSSANAVAVPGDSGIGVS